MRTPTLFALILGATVAFADTADTPEFVFRNPPPEAHAGVWWHWMGAQVTRDGIVRDLDWMARMGISSATVFGMCDLCTPWAKRIANVPTKGMRPFSDGWWKALKFACAEGKRRGIEIGLHNCPGYTSTGGPWIPPRLAMRELVFGVTNAANVSVAPNAMFPVYDEDAKTFRAPPCEARRTDYRRLGNIRGIEVGHVPMGAFVQPADWDSFGLECDKMNPEAVKCHLDHVFGELKKHLGDDLPAAGLKFILLDSYEAGNPSWTPKMREEFKTRRGYDCWDFLPILGGCTNGYASAEIVRFRNDWSRTLKDLYRDVLFKEMSRRVRAEGLYFACEPYDGPFDSREAAKCIDRLMTEFWYVPGRALDHCSHGDFNTFAGPGGRRHNIIEAEAFTGSPEQCRWTETPALLKPCGDSAWLNGVNRFTLHTCPLQPWDDKVKPGVTMGRWGTHFGRNQTWGESGKAWFDYVARSQAVLQWGAPSAKRLDIPFAQIAREKNGRTVHFIVNDSDAAKSLALRGGLWLDPTDGSISSSAPARLAPRQSGFWMADRNATSQKDTRIVATLADFSPSLGDRTAAGDAARYFSGTTVYRATFDCERREDVRFLSLGKVLGATARVTVNGRDTGTAWCEPWRVRVDENVLKEKGNELRIELVNVWANALIGEEREPKDVEFAPAPLPGGEMMLSYPDWFDGTLSKRPTKRRLFTTWNYFKATDRVVPYGILGPVTLLAETYESL